MKIGYSMVLGEVVGAAELDEALCREFQVVCPCCREAVFKAERARPDSPATHYLSHYRRRGEDALACELRVAAWGAADIERVNREGRGQALSAFMQVFADRCARLVTVLPQCGGELAADPAALLRIPNVNRFLRAWLPLVREAFLRPDAEAIRDLEEVAYVLLDEAPDGRVSEFREFRRSRLVRFALDVERHLATRQAEGNLKLLLAAACLLAVNGHVDEHLAFMPSIRAYLRSMAQDSALKFAATARRLRPAFAAQLRAAMAIPPQHEANLEWAVAHHVRCCAQRLLTLLPSLDLLSWAPLSTTEVSAERMAEIGAVVDACSRLPPEAATADGVVARR